MSSLRDRETQKARSKCARLLRENPSVQYTGGSITDGRGKWCAVAFISQAMGFEVSKLNLSPTQTLEIIDMNDVEKLTFPEIADAIEKM